MHGSNHSEFSTKNLAMQGWFENDYELCSSPIPKGTVRHAMEGEMAVKRLALFKLLLHAVLEVAH